MKNNIVLADKKIVQLAVDHPHGQLYDYFCSNDQNIKAGQLVYVSFGRRRCVALIYKIATTSNIELKKLKPVLQVCYAWKPLDNVWLKLIAFAANYYQRSIGEVAIPALPLGMRVPSRWDKNKASLQTYTLKDEFDDEIFSSLAAHAVVQKRLINELKYNLLTLTEAKKIHPGAALLIEKWKKLGWIKLNTLSAHQSIQLNSQNQTTKETSSFNVRATSFLTLSSEQQKAINTIIQSTGFNSFLLFGITGSGKTEIYLQAANYHLEKNNQAQIMVLVPEINLIPHVFEQFKQRFAKFGENAVVVLHSGLSESQRTKNWLALHLGQARIVIGTRLTALASFQLLQLIIIDEEHEASYKQQEGLKYSARDLCVWRARQLNIPIVLGSATPSLESWQQAELGHYQKLVLQNRPSTNASLPTVRMIDMNNSVAEQNNQNNESGISKSLLSALEKNLELGEQSLVFLNRRGYAPVLSCLACNWVSGCPRCSAYLVVHKGDQNLRCHHCGWNEKLPKACPQCNNVDLSPLGHGTQRIEAALKKALPMARTLRIDADSARGRDGAQKLFSNVHNGDADIILGTHMIAKGHDFQRVSLVGVVNADAALFSHDFRASERLFSQLIQVAGRAGRSSKSKQAGIVLIQTRYPQHPVFVALAKHDFASYALRLLKERKDAQLPPFIRQALLKAEAKSIEQAMAFLNEAAKLLDQICKKYQLPVKRCSAVPLSMIKVANHFRAQLLLESASRPALQECLSLWRQLRINSYMPGVIRWSIEVDPLEI